MAKEGGMRTLKGPETKPKAGGMGSPQPKGTHRLGKQPEEAGSQVNIHTNFLTVAKQQAAGRTKAAGFDIAASGPNIGDGVRTKGIIKDEHPMFNMIRKSSTIGAAQEVTQRMGDWPMGKANKSDAPKGR